MKKWVKIESGSVWEIIQEVATVPSIAHWYGQDFAAQCVEAPAEVEQGWVYDPATGTFSPPVPAPAPEPTTEEISLDLLADHEYRLCMIELGL